MTVRGGAWAYLAIGLSVGLMLVAVADAHAQGLAKIAYGSGGRLFTIEADGSHRERLTGRSRPGADYTGDSEPSFSPDGTQLAFVRTSKLSESDARTQIYLSRADGSAQRPLAPSREGVYPLSPRWSPDGQRLAFTRYRERDRRFISEIVLARLDGTGTRTVAREVIGPQSDALAYVAEPAWAPDGNQLVYTRIRLDRRYDFRPSLHLVGLTDGGRELLRKDASSADFSPDGSRIAFSSIRDKNGSICGSDECSYAGEIYVMNSDGTHPVRLTHNQGDDRQPHWSADGRHLVFSSDRNYPPGRNPELYSIAPGGSCLTWLTNGSPGSVTPDWEPDASAATDPGRCGATRRPPVVDFGPGASVREDRFRPLWLGKRFRSMLLSDVYGGGKVDFIYGDCAKFRLGQCLGDVYVEDAWICSRTSLARAGRANHLLECRGVLAAVFGRSSIQVYSGAQETTIGLPRSGEHRLATRLAAFKGLRGIHRGPGGDLPAVGVPDHLLRKLRRVQAARQRLGSAHAAADHLGISTGEARARLRLLRALGRLDSFRQIRCPSYR